MENICVCVLIFFCIYICTMYVCVCITVCFMSVVSRVQCILIYYYVHIDVRLEIFLIAIITLGNGLYIQYNNIFMLYILYLSVMRVLLIVIMLSLSFVFYHYVCIVAQLT